MADLRAQIIKLEQLHYTATLNDITDAGKRCQWMEKTLSDKLKGKLEIHTVLELPSHTLLAGQNGVNWNYTTGG